MDIENQEFGCGVCTNQPEVGAHLVMCMSFLTGTSFYIWRRLGHLFFPRFRPNPFQR